MSNQTTTMKEIIEFIKRLSPQYRYLNLDLDKEVKLRLIKADYGEYNVQFLNPVYNSWWTLPAGNAYHGGKWSLLYKGSYGAYDLRKMKAQSIQWYKQEFQTFKDVENYFKSMNREYDKMKDYYKKEAEKPNVIY